MKKTTIDIDIFSDPICPWCFIGKKRLDEALKQRPDIDANIRWHTFQLNPTMPENGMDRRDYLENKFGGPAGAKQVYGHIETTGKSEGIDFQFDKIEKTPNTVKAHRLLRLIQGSDVEAATRFKEKLFEAYFLNGQDIGDNEVLLSITQSLSLDNNAIAEFLDGDHMKKEIEEEDQMARRLGISGVPFFIVNGQYALSGAQEPKAFSPVFDLAIQNPTPMPDLESDK